MPDAVWLGLACLAAPPLWAVLATCVLRLLDGRTGRHPPDYSI